MKNLSLALLLIVSFALTSCSENFSNGERIGMVTQFSEKGLIWKSWEGHLNITQTGMNSSTGFDFSVDNDKNDPQVIAMLDSAANQGWKVKLIYHQVTGFNWFKNRGDTQYFINEVVVLDRAPTDHMFGGNTNAKAPQNLGTPDTVYVLVIDNRQFQLQPLR
jgi:hypothetical protein